MKTDYDPILATYLLGLSEDRAEAEALIERDAEARARAEVMSEGLLPPPASPSHGLWARLRGSLAEAGPLAPFLDRVCALFDLPEREVRALLDVHETEPSWPRMFPGIRSLSVTAGAGVRGAASMVWAQAGARFPAHRHLGPEHILFLRGACVDGRGQRYAAGDECLSEAESAHHFDVEDGGALLFAVVSGGATLLG